MYHRTPLSKIRKRAKESYPLLLTCRCCKRMIRLHTYRAVCNSEHSTVPQLIIENNIHMECADKWIGVDN